VTIARGMMTRSMSNDPQKSTRQRASGAILKGPRIMKKLRAALREKFGPRNYRINCRGEVHVFGVMKNTNRFGWFFFGYVEYMYQWFDLEGIE